MQLGQRTNDSHRSKTFAVKTKDAFGSILKAFKSFEILPSSRSSAFKPLPDSNKEDEDELYYPSPLFARRPTSTSQLSGSTRSTAVASTVSRQTHQTNTTAAEYTDCLTKIEKVAPVNARSSVSQCPVNQTDNSSFSFELESDSDDYPRSQSDDEDDDDDQPLLLRFKHRQNQTGFVTSLSHNPYAAFLSQPSYKQPYMFPTARRS